MSNAKRRPRRKRHVGTARAKPLQRHPPDFPGEYRDGGDGPSTRPLVFFGTGGGKRVIRNPILGE